MKYLTIVVVCHTLAVVLIAEVRPILRAVDIRTPEGTSDFTLLQTG